MQGYFKENVDHINILNNVVLLLSKYSLFRDVNFDFKSNTK